MNLSKSYEYFNPTNVSRCHIIGCGSVGSTLAEMLARLGIDNFSLYDFDIVEEKNIANQMFTSRDVGMLKTEALERMLKDINPDVNVKRFDDGWTGQRLSGHVFLCVDKIEIRKEICESNQNNQSIKSVIDFRTLLESAQMFAADWSNSDDIKNLISTMDFTHEEAKEATPVSACGVVLGVAPTVRDICCKGAVNFMKWLKGEPLKKIVISNTFGFDMTAI